MGIGDNNFFKKVKRAIRSHQILAFFILTFLITWELVFSYFSLMQHEKIFMAPLVSIATCGPALAGIIVSLVSSDEPKAGKNRQWLVFLIVLVVITAVFLGKNIILDKNPFSVVTLAVVFLLIAPPVALVLSSTASRKPAIKGYLQPLVFRKEVAEKKTG